MTTRDHEFYLAQLRLRMKEALARYYKIGGGAIFGHELLQHISPEARRAATDHDEAARTLAQHDARYTRIKPLLGRLDR